jgi:2-desacetyl-2-hydroxyethyl bacteriochlorophyllide A dehydrogenase
MDDRGARIVFPERGQVVLEAFDLPDVGPEQVLFRTRLSLVSSGTERIVLHGRFDHDTHWTGYARYPFHPGYSAVGEIVTVGDDVRDLAIGDRVAARVGHASHHVTEALGCARVPGGVDVQQATWFGLAKIALMGARVAEYGLGARVLTVGAGPIGQMTVRWVHAAGARHNAVVDPVAARRALAERGGATASVADLADRDAVVAACGGALPDVVIDATGNAEVFASVLPIVATRGRVVILGNTGSPSAQRLTDDVITRALHVVGAHDVLSMLDQPWDGDRAIHDLFFHLVRTGRFDLDGLVTNVFAPSEADAAYRALDEHPDETLGACFDWRHTDARQPTGVNSK